MFIKIIQTHLQNGIIKNLIFILLCGCSEIIIKQEYDKQSIIDYLKLLQRDSSFDDSEPSIVDKYCAVFVLKQIQGNFQIDKESALSFVRQLIQDDGNLCAPLQVLMIQIQECFIVHQDIQICQRQIVVNSNILLENLCQNVKIRMEVSYHLQNLIYLCSSWFKYFKIGCIVRNIQIKQFYHQKIVQQNGQYQDDVKLTGGIDGRINKLPNSCYSF
ncbi:unnamed protein product [Paramecium sonneborni]|uniref:Prenyltransferase alpha-alpha toroid domain-containing protein n=1 Tax=Paramecium sonneborni TaxID=65129 RepID=A0A8S1RIS2_9CILI|nr:unnamed protein product [Paramecium sonneborni]